MARRDEDRRPTTPLRDVRGRHTAEALREALERDGVLFSDALPPRPPSGSVSTVSIVVGTGRHDTSDSAPSSPASASSASSKRGSDDVATLTAPPLITTPQERALRLAALSQQIWLVCQRYRDAICCRGWKCWQTSSCGGAFVQDGRGRRSFEHREPVLHADPVHVGQYAICLSFLRRCRRARAPISSDTLFRVLDAYVLGGLERHPCGSPEHASSDGVGFGKLVDDHAKLFVYERTRAGMVQDTRPPRGMLVLAALCARCTASDESGSVSGGWTGPGVPLSVEPRPPPLQRSASGRTDAHRRVSSEPTSPDVRYRRSNSAKRFVSVEQSVTAPAATAGTLETNETNETRENWRRTIETLRKRCVTPPAADRLQPHQ
jgi:hypothetical protein